VEAAAVIIETRAVPPFDKNGFVVASETTRDAVIIDPGDEVDELLEILRRQKLTASHILLTHAHVDHLTGVGRAKRALQVPICLHKDDNFLYEAVPQQAAFFGFQAETPPPVDHFYDSAEMFSLGEYEITVHHTPGHCPGGVCLAVAMPGRSERELFVGDTLFAGAIGRTDLPGADYGTLMRSIREVLFGFGDAARVHPGQERRSNPFLQT
jgi:hydroxyacylglutathione hydrolase